MRTFRLHLGNGFEHSFTSSQNTKLTFLVNGSPADCSVFDMTDAGAPKLLSQQKSISPGNISKPVSLKANTRYKAQINPHGDPKLSHATISW